MLAITNDPVIAGVILLFGGTLSTQAGPPFFTDDPDVIEYRHWQFYLATQEVKHGKDEWSGTAPHLEVDILCLGTFQAGKPLVFRSNQNKILENWWELVACR